MNRHLAPARTFAAQTQPFLAVEPVDDMLADPPTLSLQHDMNAAIAEPDVDPIQFAAIMAVNLGMGLITPPTAPILYFGALIGKAQVGYMMKPALVFVLGAYLPVVLLVTFIPELSLALPRWALG